MSSARNRAASITKLTLRIGCPHCGQRLTASNNILGQSIQCPACKKRSAVEPAQTKLAFACAQCNTALTAQATPSDREMPCPKCQTMLHIPGPVHPDSADKRLAVNTASVEKRASDSAIGTLASDKKLSDNDIFDLLGGDAGKASKSNAVSDEQYQRAIRLRELGRQHAGRGELLHAVECYAEAFLSDREEATAVTQMGAGLLLGIMRYFQSAASASLRERIPQHVEEVLTVLTVNPNYLGGSLGNQLRACVGDTDAKFLALLADHAELLLRQGWLLGHGGASLPWLVALKRSQGQFEECAAIIADARMDDRILPREIEEAMKISAGIPSMIDELKRASTLTDNGELLTSGGFASPLIRNLIAATTNVVTAIDSRRREAIAVLFPATDAGSKAIVDSSANGQSPGEILKGFEINDVVRSTISREMARFYGILPVAVTETSLTIAINDDANPRDLEDMVALINERTVQSIRLPARGLAEAIHDHYPSTSSRDRFSGSRESKSAQAMTDHPPSSNVPHAPSPEKTAAQERDDAAAPGGPQKLNPNAPPENMRSDIEKRLYSIACFAINESATRAYVWKSPTELKVFLRVPSWTYAIEMEPLPVSESDLMMRHLKLSTDRHGVTRVDLGGRLLKLRVEFRAGLHGESAILTFPTAESAANESSSRQHAAEADGPKRFCPHCAAPLPAKQKFCTQCANRPPSPAAEAVWQELECSRCGARLTRRGLTNCWQCHSDFALDQRPSWDRKSDDPEILPFAARDWSAGQQ